MRGGATAHPDGGIYFDLYDINEGNQNNLWITSSYDATSHFETASEEIL